MNYSKVYNQIIDRAKGRNLQEYTEKHHIVPRSLGGSDDKSNLVRLTPREHLIAHMLLVQIYKGTRAYYSMVQALIFMCSSGSMTQGELKSSTHYEKLRVEVSEITRQRNLDRVKSGLNPFAGEKGSKLAKEKAQKAISEGKCPLTTFITPEDKSRNVKAYWASLSPEERKAKNQKTADSMSQEEKAEIAELSAKARKENDLKLIQERQRRMVRINLFGPEIIGISGPRQGCKSDDGVVREFTNLEELGKFNCLLIKTLENPTNENFTIVINDALRILKQTHKGLGLFLDCTTSLIGPWTKNSKHPPATRKNEVLNKLQTKVSELITEQRK